MTSIQVFPDTESLTRAAADLIVRQAAAAITARGRFGLVLSGGSTPRSLYQLLASPGYRDRVEWGRVFLYWGDERCVPPTHEASNYRMACEALIDHVPIPLANVHRMRGEDAPADAADAYERTIREFASASHSDSGDASVFDLVLLGLGADGHTASLFPGKPATRETHRWAMAEYLESQAMWRLTITLPAINAARSALFMVTGAGKASALGAALGEAATSDAQPTQHVLPSGHAPLWMVDQAAAQHLTITNAL